MTTSAPAEGLSPAMYFTAEEAAALTASLSASLQQLETDQGHAGIPSGNHTWTVLNSLRTAFAEVGYGLERPRHNNPT